MVSVLNNEVKKRYFLVTDYNFKVFFAIKTHLLWQSSQPLGYAPPLVHSNNELTLETCTPTDHKNTTAIFY